jgi:hypothetical protein
LAALGVLPLFRALSLSLFFINIMAAALFNALKCIWVFQLLIGGFFAAFNLCRFWHFSVLVKRFEAPSNVWYFWSVINMDLR